MEREKSNTQSRIIRNLTHVITKRVREYRSQLLVSIRYETGNDTLPKHFRCTLFW